jgi:hypothetical protein
VMSQIDKSLGDEKQKQTDTDEDKAVGLMNDIVKFKTNRTSMTADEAVDAWLMLYDRFWMLPQTALVKTKEMNPALPGGENRLSVNALMSAIPPPATWDKLKKRKIPCSAFSPIT